jgi:hypothetical protein
MARKKRNTSSWRSYSDLEMTIRRAKCPMCKKFHLVKLYGWYGTGQVYKYCQTCHTEAKAMAYSVDQFGAAIDSETKTGTRPSQ